MSSENSSLAKNLAILSLTTVTAVAAGALAYKKIYNDKKEETKTSSDSDEKARLIADAIKLARVEWEKERKKLNNEQNQFNAKSVTQSQNFVQSQIQNENLRNPATTTSNSNQQQQQQNLQSQTVQSIKEKSQQQKLKATAAAQAAAAAAAALGTAGSDAGSSGTAGNRSLTNGPNGPVVPGRRAQRGRGGSHGHNHGHSHGHGQNHSHAHPHSHSDDDDDMENIKNPAMFHEYDIVKHFLVDEDAMLREEKKRGGRQSVTYNSAVQSQNKTNSKLDLNLNSSIDDGNSSDTSSIYISGGHTSEDERGNKFLDNFLGTLYHEEELKLESKRMQGQQRGPDGLRFAEDQNNYNGTNGNNGNAQINNQNQLDNEILNQNIMNGNMNDEHNINILNGNDNDFDHDHDDPSLLDSSITRTPTPASQIYDSDELQLNMAVGVSSDTTCNQEGVTFGGPPAGYINSHNSYGENEERENENEDYNGGSGCCGGGEHSGGGCCGGGSGNNSQNQTQGQKKEKKTSASPNGTGGGGGCCGGSGGNEGGCCGGDNDSDTEENVTSSKRQKTAEVATNNSNKLLQTANMLTTITSGVSNNTTTVTDSPAVIFDKPTPSLSSTAPPPLVAAAINTNKANNVMINIPPPPSTLPLLLTKIPRPPAPPSTTVVPATSVLTNGLSNETSFYTPGRAKIWLRTFGCSHNISDSEVMLGLLQQQGYQIVSGENDVDLADVIIVNSCSVKNPSQDAAVNLVRHAATKKKVPVILTGCVSQADPGLVKNLEKTNVSIVGLSYTSKIVEAVESCLVGNRVYMMDFLKNPLKDAPKLPDLMLPKVRKNKFIEIIAINTGCLGSCTYCKTKYARGTLKSYPVHQIVERAKQAFAEGVQQIWLTSEDTGAYGLDLKPIVDDKTTTKGPSKQTTIVTLLEALLPIIPKINDKEGKGGILRLGMTNPPYMARHAKRIGEILGTDNVFEFLHIPVQSGCDEVLTGKKGRKNLDNVTKAEDYTSNVTLDTNLDTETLNGVQSAAALENQAGMNREYTAAVFSRMCENLLSSNPKMTIATDIICGFPGEKDSSHVKTLDLIKRFQFPIVNISQFYARPGTPAVLMKRVPTEIGKQRSREVTNCFLSYTTNEYLMENWKNIKEDNSKKSTSLIGGIVCPDPKDPDNLPPLRRVWFSDTEYRKNQTAGHTKQHVKIVVPRDDNLLGCVRVVRILSTTKWHAVGEVVWDWEKKEE